MAQSPLLTIGVWQRKSADVSCQNKDGLIFAVNKGFNAMAAVLSKDSDPDEVQCALDLLNCERSIALRYDKSKDDSLRDLMYGVLESLHVSLKEWTEERNQVKEIGEISTQTEESIPSLDRNQRKEMGEISTQTDEDPLLSLLEPPLHEACIPIDNNASNDLFTNPPPSFPIKPKEESIESHQLPLEYRISASELMRDEKMFKEEEMDNENTELVIPHSNPIFNDSLDILDQVPPSDTLRDEMDFNDEEMANDDVTVHRDSMEEDIRLEDVENSGMGDAVNDSLREQPFEEDDSLRMIQPSDVMDYLFNFDDEILGDRDLSANNLINNDGEEEGHPIDTTEETSDSVKNEKRRRSSRQVSRPIRYTEPVEDYDDHIGPSVKKLRSSSTRKGYNMSPASNERHESKMNDTELECPECEYHTWTVRAWIDHLRKKHSTTPALAGFALLCECGNESLSDGHSRATNHCKTTVIRKRDDPILRLNDDKATPQCVLCEMFPKTACGYVSHLQNFHKSSLMQNGAYLKCSCGLEVRSNSFSRLKHLDECNPRQFTLHKLNEK